MAYKRFRHNKVDIECAPSIGLYHKWKKGAGLPLIYDDYTSRKIISIGLHIVLIDNELIIYDGISGENRLSDRLYCIRNEHYKTKLYFQVNYSGIKICH